MISASEFLKWLNVFNVMFGGGSITIPVSMGQGGTGAVLSPSAGSLFYSTASHGALLPTAANGVLITDPSGNPSISSSLPTGLTVPGYLPLTGGTLTGNLTLVGNPTTPLEAVPKQYADLIASGFTPIGAVYAASTADLTGWTYSNGSSGVGATLTAPTTGVFSVDGVSPPVGMFFLYKDDSTYSGVANGIYQITTSAGGSDAVLTRATYYNQPDQIKIGTLVAVEYGTVNAGSTWFETMTVTTVGTDPLGFNVLIQPSSFLQVANNLSDVADITTAFNNISPLTTKGDTIYFDGTNNVRLAIGSTGYILSIAAGTPEWIANPGLLIANNLSDVASTSTAVSNLGLTIGTDTQAWSALLDEIAAGTWTGASSITTLGTIATGVWNGTIITGTYGGTGVNNGASTITIGGNVTFSGAHTFAATLTANTAVTFPTFGTLATTSQLPTGAALTEVDDTNVTLTLGGTPATSLLQAVSLTLGWTGTLAGSRGGLGAAITANNGGIYYSTASNGALLAGTTTAAQMLMSGASTAPTWSTNVWPNTAAVNSLLWASSANTIAALTPSDNGVLISGTTGIPSWLANSGTPGYVLTANSGAPPSWQAAGGSGIVTLDGDSGSATGSTVTISGGSTGLTTSGSSATITIGGTLALTNGGTGNSLTANNGGIVWSDASKLNILAGTSTAAQMLMSGASGAPTWSTTTWPVTVSANDLLYASAANTISALNSGPATWLTTSNLSVPTWQGLPVVLGFGGTGNSLTANNGGIVWSDASKLNILAGTSTAGQMLTSGATATPAWTTNTWPATAAVNSILFASSANVIGLISPAASSILISSSGNVPSWGTTLPTAVQTNITELGTITVGAWQSTTIGAAYGGTGVANGATSTITLGGAVTFSGAYSFTGTLTNNTSVTFPTSGTLIGTAPGSSGNVLTSNGTTWASSAPPGGGVLSVSVNLNQAQIQGMYATPVQIIAAVSGVVFIPISVILYYQYTTAAFASGGNPALTYGSSAHAAGTKFSTTFNSTILTGSANAISGGTGDITGFNTATGVTNVGIYISNATGPFTNGNAASVLTVQVLYYAITATT